MKKTMERTAKMKFTSRKYCWSAMVLKPQPTNSDCLVKYVIIHPNVCSLGSGLYNW